MGQVIRGIEHFQSMELHYKVYVLKDNTTETILEGGESGGKETNQKAVTDI